MKSRKVIMVVGLLMVGLMAAPKAYAARTRNVNTGNRSENRTVVRDRKTVQTSHLKLGGAVNIDLADLNTGGNRTNGNTNGDNDADSGDANAKVTTTDDVNFSDVMLTQKDSKEEDSAVNHTTGNRSKNYARVEKTRRVTYRGASMGLVLNVSDAQVNTGRNSASRNTKGENSAKSGDAAATAHHSSFVNSTYVRISQ